MKRQLADTRNPMSVTEADELFRQIALDEAALNRCAIECDKKITELKAAHDLRTAEQRIRHEANTAKLRAYIAENRERFEKPRNRKTTFGCYGLRTATKLELYNEAAVAAYSDENALELFTVKRKFSAQAITSLINSGNEVPGARISVGVIAGYKLDFAVIENETRGGR